MLYKELLETPVNPHNLSSNYLEMRSDDSHRTFLIFVTSRFFLTLQIFKVSQKALICFSFISMLKTPSIEIIYDDCKSQNFSNLAKRLFIMVFCGLQEHFIKYFSLCKCRST